MTDTFVQALFDDVLFRMGIIDMDEVGGLEYVRVNTAQAQFLGIPPEQAPGLKLSAFTTPEVFALLSSKYREALETRRPVMFDFEGSRLHPGFYSVSLSFLGMSPAGRPRFGFITLDATVRRRLEERLQSILDLLRKQKEEILALSTPLLQIGDGILALPVIGALDEERARLILEKLLAEIARARIRVAILDLTSASAVDEATANHLLGIARAARLLGSRCLLSGISPRIAQTMVALGVDASALATFGTLKDALEHARRG